MKRRDASALLLLGSLAASHDAGAFNLRGVVRGMRSAAKAVMAMAGVMSAEELAAQRAAEAARNDAAAAHASEKLNDALEAYRAQAQAASDDGDDLVFATRSKHTATGSLTGLQAGRKRLLGSLSRLYGKRPRMVMASASAKRFGKEFLVGAKEGQARLERLGPKLSGLAGHWLRTPVEKRVFVIGAAADLPEIAKLRAQVEAEGYAFFFYKFCEPLLSSLCKSEDVGAFFATAGHVISVKSPAAAGSDYIPVELAASESLLEGGALFITTPEEIVQLDQVANKIGTRTGTPARLVQMIEFDTPDDKRHSD
jgi:hypothetical protein